APTVPGLASCPVEDALVPPDVLAADEWRTLPSAHEQRVAAWVDPHLARRRDHVSHPVEDFLFTYYSFRPAALQRWHPGFGTALADAEEYAVLKGYDDRGGAVGVTREHVRSQRSLLESTRALLAATASRPANFGCFG